MGEVKLSTGQDWTVFEIVELQIIFFYLYLKYTACKLFVFGIRNLQIESVLYLNTEKLRAFSLSHATIYSLAGIADALRKTIVCNIEALNELYFCLNWLNWSSSTLWLHQNRATCHLPAEKVAVWKYLWCPRSATHQKLSSSSNTISLLARFNINYSQNVVDKK